MNNHRTKKPTNGASPDTLGKNGFNGKNSLLEERMDAKKKQRNALFINAVISRNLEKVEELWKKGADVDAKDERGRSALKWAKFTGAKDIEEFLKSKGAKE